MTFLNGFWWYVLNTANHLDVRANWSMPVPNGGIPIWCYCCTYLAMKPMIIYLFGTGQISSKVEPVSTDTSTFPSSKEATGGSYSSSKGNTASLLPSSSLDSTRKSKPAHAHPAQQLQCELQAAQTQVLRQWGKWILYPWLWRCLQRRWFRKWL